MSQAAVPRATGDYTRLHLRLGWWSLLFFLLLGLTLETLHGFKVGWYLDVANGTRRLMWTLAHAHGTLISLVHVAFAVALHAASASPGKWLRFASPALIGAGILLPGGFLLGGTVIYGGDPGVGIFLVPVGAAFLFVAVLLTALNLCSKKSGL